MNLPGKRMNLPGKRVRLKAKERLNDSHTADRRVVICAEPRKVGFLDQRLQV
jgi:hypothetical protein